MVALDLDKSHSVGLEVFDTEHRTLLDLLNQLTCAIHYARGETDVRQIVERIIAADLQLADAAEHAFGASASSAFAEHRAEHAELRGRLRGFLQLLESPDLTRQLDLLLFLSNWLDDHIQNDRRRFGPPAAGTVH